MSETTDASVSDEQKEWMEIQEAIAVLNPSAGVKKIIISLSLESRT
jgi:hypothetical protein